MKTTKEIGIKKINNGVQVDVVDSIIVERTFNIHVNRKFYASVMCSPNETMELTIGFLFSEGVISSMNSIKSIEEKGDNSICIILKEDLKQDFDRKKALTSGCAGGSIDLKFLEENEINAIKSSYSYEAKEVLALMREFNNKSDLFKETGGVHSCSICNSEGILFFSEDIGRHNAMDKVIGKALLNNVELENKLVLTTGRISSEIIVKAARAGIPIIISHSAPTDLALEIAQATNMTMAGFARGSRMSIYCGTNRIIY